MTSIELQDHLHVYSMFSFIDGHKEPGILINKYSLLEMSVEYYFVCQQDMNNYKIAFENSDRQICDRLCNKIQPEDIESIQPVSINDYRMQMQLLDQRTNQVNLNR